MMGGNEILAATIAAILTGVLGLVFAFGNIIWQQNQWSLLKELSSTTLGQSYQC